MPVESAFLPSQSAFPGLPLEKKSSKTINTANLIGLAVLVAFHLPNTAIPPR